MNANKILKATIYIFTYLDILGTVFFGMFVSIGIMIGFINPILGTISIVALAFLITMLIDINR